MKNPLFRFLKSFFTEQRWSKVRGVFWFFVITLAFHILWRVWATTFQFAPVSGPISAIRTTLSQWVYTESTFILRDILNLTIRLEPDVIVTKNELRLAIHQSSSGLKQICQFAVLILIFRGYWKNKLWFIPLGIIIVHLTNVFRIISMVIIAMHWPLQIHYAHDNYLRILYYVVIFLLWLFWVEKAAYLKPGDLLRKK